VLLVWAPLASLSLVGQEHGRTIPLADISIELAADEAIWIAGSASLQPAFFGQIPYY